jgi:hypothetical protein
MTDPYRISEAPETHHRAAHAGTRGGLLRPVLWLVLIVSAAANGVASNIEVSPLLGICFGVVTLASAVALAVHHYRHRRG